MEITKLHNQLREGIVDNFYIFTGPEWAVQKLYIEQLSKVKSIPVKYVDNMKDIYSSLSSSLFSNNFVFVIRDDKDIQTNQKLQYQLKDNLLHDSVLIYLWTNPDKRKKFYKEFEQYIVEFDYLKPQVLKKYIDKQIPLSDKNIDKLMEVCQYDYGRCLLEIDKVRRYQSHYSKDIFPNDAFQLLLKDGTIHTPPKDVIFDFVDAVLVRDIKMFDLLKESYASGEATMVLLSVLYTNAKQLLQVQSCSSNDIPKSTGLTAWQVKCAQKRAGNWSNSELIHLMRTIQKVEKGIKIGQFDEQNAVEYVLINTL